MSEGVTDSFDDVLPPPDDQYIYGGPIAWVIVGHLMWATGLAYIALMEAGTVWFALAAAHALALVLALVARATMARSIAVARAVAWVSTPLFGAPLVLLGTEIPGVLVFLEDALNPFTPEPEVVPSFLVLNVLLSLPTIGAFVAAVSHARSLRGG